MPDLIGRRTLLAGLAASTTTPLFAQSLPTSPDVVIVGAGSAGLAAGRTLKDAGISFVIVEAADRVGGRAYTESTTFGQPVDHGCSWMNGSTENIYAKLAKVKGFTLVDHSDPGYDLFDLAGNRADDAEWQAFSEAWNTIPQAISAAGRAGKDVSIASVVPDMPYAAAVKFDLALVYGKNVDEISTKEWWSGASANPQALAREGLGTLVAMLAEDLPISLGTAVTGIDYSGDGVSVETSKGTIRAKACLVTVSTGVLNAGKIRFTPDLPVWKQEAIANIPMGLLMKVPLMFDGARLGLGENNWVSYRLEEDNPGEAITYLAWPCGLDYLMGFMGGDFAWSLYAEGQDAVVDYAMSELERLVGGDARKHFKGGFASDWADNPNVLGAYGVVRPGAFEARREIGKPVDDKLFFGGEAAAGALTQRVDGAYDSGRTNAQQIITRLN
ncbi:MAG: NAD(P)/FAD-dependent oxidoreductase [Pseudomonadota bacterium]